MIKPVKNELWLVDLTDGKGHEQKGKRPAVVIASFALVEMSLVIPLTSNASASRFPCTIKIMPSKDNGLESESIALVFQLTSIDNSRLIHKIGKIVEPDQQKITALIQEELRA